MAPTLYTVEASPLTRAILMVAKAIDLELNLKNINIFRKEHLQPEFLQLNPQHTIPTLVDDDGFALWESAAIMAYLVSKYSKGNDLYPLDPKKLAVVNQRLYFHTDVVFFHMENIAHAVIWNFESKVPEKEKKATIEGYGLLEKFLKGNEWVAGDFVSIADYLLIATISTLNLVVPVCCDNYPNVVAWMERCEGLSGYPANENGLKQVANTFRMRLSRR